ncbi:hypothetical protein GWI33_019644 [Rhynchophorus ferrugineus]|uniref:Uncharacterized protein n=1 Tax=Rhynchophorus ferrugineus TaxID=354439 RepID=A0A834M538_RHYFE|nr:hypothetical protein GWI33_019644 [Rhynchophorus ferrugineus]
MQCTNSSKWRCREDTLKISTEHVHQIIHEYLDLKRYCVISNKFPFEHQMVDHPAKINNGQITRNIENYGPNFAGHL